ncbi:PAS domain-containing protein [Geomonas sp. RF6]|uniref:ATP-binding protein n=1 Tax=Geomonas sp. RF6 TaxID=2897342 RepID=UPI001E29B143|nr:ATP-binding protein [Geomonas sp. RF6]UFS70235.1 PAS domain-containing protein [Geomonas sp. RF6]
MKNGRASKTHLVALRIVAIYASFSALWIYLSDHIVGLLVSDPDTLISISTFKGILFILLTSWLLFRLILQYVDKSERANSTVRESESRMNKAEEMAHLGSWELDVVNNVLTWSDEVYRIFGLAPQAFAATYEAFLDVVHPDDRAAVDAAYSASLKDASDSYEIGHRVVRRSTGEIRYVLEKCEHIRDCDGRITRSLGMVYDITESMRAAEALKKANEELEERVAQRTEELEKSRQELEKQNRQLRDTYRELELETAERIRALRELRHKDQMLIQQNRLAAMGEMLGNIAHQWRQPLNVLALMVQEMGLRFEVGEWNKDHLDSYVAKTMEILEHMSQTIEDFRNFSTPSKEKAPFSVNDLIARTLFLFEQSFGAQGVSIKVSTSGNPVINGFRNEYGQVLINLLTNARDALVEQGTKDPVIYVHSRGEQGKSVVTVADNAGGIDEKIMDRIFDAYFTTKDHGKGSGIGLFMSKSIIEKSMGGHITVRNAERGAEFTIEVPAVPGEAALRNLTENAPFLRPR